MQKSVVKKEKKTVTKLAKPWYFTTWKESWLICGYEEEKEKSKAKAGEWTRSGGLVSCN